MGTFLTRNESSSIMDWIQYKKSANSKDNTDIDEYLNESFLEGSCQFAHNFIEYFRVPKVTPYEIRIYEIGVNEASTNKNDT